jgi:hypothetical protein
MKQAFCLVSLSLLLISGASALAASDGGAKGAASPGTVSADGVAKSSENEPARANEHPAIGDQGRPFTLEGTDLGRMLNRDASSVSIMRLRGGVMKLDVGDGFRSVLVVQITPEGKTEISCIMSEKAAERIFASQRNKTPETPKEP